MPEFDWDKLILEQKDVILGAIQKHNSSKGQSSNHGGKDQESRSVLNTTNCDVNMHKMLEMSPDIMDIASIA